MKKRICEGIFFLDSDLDLKATARAKNDEELLSRLKKLRLVNPELKILISVGGANAEANRGFAKATETPASRWRWMQA